MKKFHISKKGYTFLRKGLQQKNRNSAPFRFFCCKLSLEPYNFLRTVHFFIVLAPLSLPTSLERMYSNDHKISYKLCRSVLEVQRDNFRPPIIFPATFGQMASHILRSRKSQNSPKNRFWPKIQISIEWPILAEMMIYGRKWVPEVF